MEELSERVRHRHVPSIQYKLGMKTATINKGSKNDKMTKGAFRRRAGRKGVVSWYPHITIIINNIMMMIIVIIVMMSTSSSPSSILLSTVFAQTRRAVIAKLRDKVTRRIFRE